MEGGLGGERSDNFEKKIGFFYPSNCPFESGKKLERSGRGKRV